MPLALAQNIPVVCKGHSPAHTRNFKMPEQVYSCKEITKDLLYDLQGKSFSFWQSSYEELLGYSFKLELGPESGYLFNPKYPVELLPRFYCSLGGDVDFNFHGFYTSGDKTLYFNVYSHPSHGEMIRAGGFSGDREAADLPKTLDENFFILCKRLRKR